MILNTIKKRARIIAIMLLVLFGASSASYFIYLASALYKNNKDSVALLINGKVFKRSELELLLSNKFYDESFKVLNLNKFIERVLLLQKARALHISISSKEINDEYNRRVEQTRREINSSKNNISDNELIIRILSRTSPGEYILEKGSPYKILRKVIEDDIILKRLKEKIENSYAPSEEDIEAKYNEGDKKRPLAEVKEHIIEQIRSNKKSEYYVHWLKNFVKESNIELKDENYKIYLEGPALVLDDLSISNVDFYYTILMCMQYPFLLDINEELDDEYQKELIYKKVYNNFVGEIVLAKEALKRNLEVEKNIFSREQIHELIKALRINIFNKLNYSDKDVETYFNRNKSKYDEKERLYAYIVPFDISPSSEDIYNLRNEAEKVLKEALEKKSLLDNKKILSREEFNKNFNIKIKENEIHPEILRRENSYYIVRALKDEVEYIKIDERASHKTKEEIREKVSNIISDVKSEKIIFEKILEIYAKEVDKKERGPLYRDTKSINKNLLDKLFASKQDDIFTFEDSDVIYVVKKSKYFPEKRALFNNFKSKVIEDYKKEEVEKEIISLREKLILENKVEIKDENINYFIKK